MCSCKPGKPCAVHEKRTPREWERDERYDMVVMDPDGWRFLYGELQPRSFDDPITREEYESRSVYSTLMDRREFNRSENQHKGQQE